MKKIVILTLALFIALPVYSFAASTACKTKNPIVLAHGMALKNQMFGTVEYFWKVKSTLNTEGAQVYEVSVDAMNSTEAKAQQFKTQVLQILAVSGATKVNVIGHSHGTLYSRYAMSNLGMGKYVSSHTSLCGPHRGSAIADLVLGYVPSFAKYLVGGVLDVFYKVLMGDESPNALANGASLGRTYMEKTFNPNTPNIAGIYYQSYAGKKKALTADLVFEPTFIVMSLIEGANDGIVSVKSAKWGVFKGEVSGAWWSGGLSHFNMHGQILGVTPGWDHLAFYKGIAKDLKARGY